MPTGHGSTRERIGDITPEYALSCGYSLAIACPGCKAMIPVDLLALAVAKGNAPLRTIVFRCTRTLKDGRPCRSIGQPYVGGQRGGERVTWS